jgi:hypothetical protein
MPLEPLDEQHCRAALGYAELSMFLYANAQLDKISPSDFDISSDMARYV